MMKNTIFLSLAFVTLFANAQIDMSGIRAAGAAQEQNTRQAEEQRRQYMAEQKERERVRAEQERMAQERAFEVEKKRIDAAQAAERDRMALVRERQAREEKEKSRNRAFEDEQRRLDLMDRKADLATKRARADRSNDYIDRELSREDAKTNVVNSNADANRNLSEGGRDMMRGIGKGAERGR